MAVPDDQFIVTVGFRAGDIRGTCSERGLEMREPGPRGGSGVGFEMDWQTWDLFVAHVERSRAFLRDKQRAIAPPPVG